jgi:hypothetical protein
MKFQVGDKVKFLNTKGGGIVSKIITPTLVNVMIEDGFEIPTITSELIKIEPQGKAERMFDEDFGGSRQSSAISKFRTADRRPPTGNRNFPTARLLSVTTHSALKIRLEFTWLLFRMTRSGW